jgi:threonine aldolase
MIDLRSDTVTKPTQKMREKMFTAEVGDDVFEDDLTVKHLQDRLSKMFNKEDALFFPSGTMANLTALLAWCNERGSEVILGDKSHIFLFEQASASQFGGISLRTVPNLSNGTMDIETIVQSIRDTDIHEPITKLICIENTHNVCGGRILPLKFIEDLHNTSNKLNIPIHLDGARLWNAIAAQQIQPHIISDRVDSLSVCLSKGLGAPIGSVLLGKKEFIKKARRIRKALGGGMRQVGVIAAASIQALDDFESNILLKDHILTIKFAEELLTIPYLQIDINSLETNIIFAKVVNYKINAHYICKICYDNGILISAWSADLLRFVIHRDINNDDLQKVINVLSSIKC